MFIFRFKFHLIHLGIAFDSSLQIKNSISWLWRDILYMCSFYTVRVSDCFWVGSSEVSKMVLFK